MYKALTLIFFILFSSYGQAKETLPLYQIDLIIFTYQASSFPEELSLTKKLSGKTGAIPLQTEISNTITPYHLLPPSSSQLRQEYGALHRKPQYHVLLNYTWLQPGNNQNFITIPQIYRDGWQVEGTLRIRQNNYYLLDTELLFSSPNDNKFPFIFAQTQRLKSGEIYYLDHPQAGMVIKIHPLETA